LKPQTTTLAEVEVRFLRVAERNITDSYKMEYVLSTQVKGLQDANGNLYTDVSDLYVSCRPAG
jgi:hypothetical protein